MVTVNISDLNTDLAKLIIEHLDGVVITDTQGDIYM